MRFVIFGSCSLGGNFGARLSHSGQDVTFIARGAHLQAMQSSGLRVDSLNGDFVLPGVKATDDPSSLGPADVVILGVKTWQVPDAAQAIRPLVGEGTLVLPLQNGIEAPAQLAEALGKEHVLGGLCRLSSLVAAPGHIRHVGLNPTIAFGELDNRRSERVEALRQAFAQAVGCTPEVPADIHVALWTKFLFIAPFSGVGAVTRVPAGVLRAVPETRQMLIAAMHEVESLAAAQGIHLAPDAIDKTLAIIDNSPVGMMASMQRDIIDGRPSELEAQNGAVVRLARAAGVPVPVNTCLYASLLPAELKAREKLP